jgi:hypothetical protein
MPRVSCMVTYRVRRETFNRYAPFNRFAPFKRFERFELLERLSVFALTVADAWIEPGIKNIRN